MKLHVGNVVGARVGASPVQQPRIALDTDGARGAPCERQREFPSPQYRSSTTSLLDSSSRVIACDTMRRFKTLLTWMKSVGRNSILTLNSSRR